MSLSVVTASYAPDFASFVRLHESVVANTSEEVRHIVAVPDAHEELFRSIGSAKLDVLPYGSLLPPRFLQTAWIQTVPRLPRGFRIAALNARRPWPPVRGWIMQQAVKLAVVSGLTSDVALLIDSDVLVVRPLHETTFRTANGAVRLYRRPFGITETMTRHLAQRSRALCLLDLDATEPDLPDYITAFVSWSPNLVRECLARIEATTGGDWWNPVCGSLDFSEFITYGTYVMMSADPREREFVEQRSLCHSHWGVNPLTMETARRFLDELQPDDLAIHVQSNSSTDESVLRFIAEAAAKG